MDINQLAKYCKGIAEQYKPKPGPDNPKEANRRRLVRESMRRRRAKLYANGMTSRGTKQDKNMKFKPLKWSS